MKYFYDTEFLEGTQKKWIGGKTKPTIDIISIGIVCEDGREYYAVNKDFNLKEAWNRYDEKPNMDYKPNFGGGSDGHYNPQFIREYWLRDNVLKPIWKELIEKERKYYLEMFKRINVWTKYIDDDYYKFTYKEFKRLIKNYGKTNKQIAKEVKHFVANRPIEANKEQWILDYDTKDVSFYGYYSDYDWVVFCWLFGKMIDLPNGFPMYCIDLKQELDNRLKVTNTESKLWDLLDNIGSASDIFKPNNDNKYVQYIYSKLKHHELLSCDGYNITSKYKSIDEIKALPNYPKQTNEHNALSDARWNYELYKFLNTL